jgi:hypothetical protein
MKRTNLYLVFVASFLGVILGIISTYAFMKDKISTSASEIMVRKISGDLGYLQGMLKRRPAQSTEVENVEFKYWPQLEMMAVNAWLAYAAGAKSLHEKGLVLPPGSMSPEKVAEFPDFVGEFKLLNDNRINFKPACRRFERYFGVTIESSDKLMHWFMEHYKQIKQSPSLTEP